MQKSKSTTFIGQISDPLIIHDVPELNFRANTMDESPDESVDVSPMGLSSLQQNYSCTNLHSLQLPAAQDEQLDKKQKSTEKSWTLLHGLQAVNGSVFYPTKVSLGNQGYFQTVLSAWRERKYNKGQFGGYDVREVFTLPDGGITYIDCKGENFYLGPRRNTQNATSYQRPLLLLVPGLTQDSVQPAILMHVEHLIEGGYDVAVINYRGHSGAPITTPMISGPCSWRDIIYPMEYMYRKYIKGTNRKVFGIGFSMGASLLANILGYIADGSFDLNFDGACCVQPFYNFKDCYTHGICKSMNGFFNKHLGMSLYKQIMKHQKKINEKVVKDFGKPLKDVFHGWTKETTTLWRIDTEVSYKYFDFETPDQYFEYSSAIHRLPMIQVPTLFINALDDPIIAEVQIDYSAFKQNKNIAVATTETGGHLGYHCSVNNQRMWAIEPCLKYFDALALLTDDKIEEL